jgi:two-component system, sensor histidine kinase LadS
MFLLRWIRSAAVLACFLLLASAHLVAHAASGPRWEVSVYGGGATATGLTAQQIAAKPAFSFSAFDASTIYATGLQKNVWLRVRITSEQALPANAWLVGISKPFADTVVLHTKSSQGVWSEQAAGDRLGHNSWPVRSLAPQFFVPAQPQGSQDLYLEVRNRTPLRFEVNLLSAPAAAIKAQDNFFLVGLSIGLMLLTVIASCVLTAANRNTVYLWYGIYVITHILVCLSYSGIAAYALWPEATQWPEMSITVLFMLGNVLQLQFCRAMFLTSATPIWIRRTVLAVVGLGLLSIALNLYVIANFGSAAVFTLHVLVFSALCFMIIVRQFSTKNSTSWLYLLASLPLTVIGWLAVIENAGWIALTWLPYNAPIYAFAIEMPILFSAVYLHAKLEHAAKVRKSTLASTDPLTGFVNSELHMQTFELALDQSRDTGRDLVVAYVQVLHQVDHLGAVQELGREHSVERAVRLLRTVVREQDLVTHVDTNLFAILMPDMSLGDDLTNRLARLVALAVMTDQDAARHVPMRFRIAASSARSYSASSAKLHASLQRKLAESGWGQRAIRYVRNVSGQGRRSGSSLPEETLSQFWQRAAQEESYPTTRQDKAVN